MSSATVWRSPFEKAPAWLGPTLSTGGRVVAAMLALWVALDVTYARTQVAASIFAIVGLLSLLRSPQGSSFTDGAASLAAGVLFFGGAMLWSESPARGMLPTAALALVGVAMTAANAGRSTGLPATAFFAGLAVDVAVLVLVALAIEG